MLNSSKINELANHLGAVRDARKDVYAPIYDLLNELGYKGTTLSSKHVDAFLIKITECCFNNNKTYRDMVLMAFGLLHGYRRVTPIESRRALFLIYSNYLIICYSGKNRDYLSADKNEQANMREALRKKEDSCFKNIVSFLSAQDNITKFVNKIDDYVTKNNKDKIISVNIPYPTYLVDGCAEYRTRIAFLEIIKIKNYVESICDKLGIENKKSKAKKIIQAGSIVVIICSIVWLVSSSIPNRVARSQEPSMKIEITELSPMKDSEGQDIDEGKLSITNDSRVILTNEDKTVGQSLNAY